MLSVRMDICLPWPSRAAQKAALQRPGGTRGDTLNPGSQRVSTGFNIGSQPGFNQTLNRLGEPRNKITGEVGDHRWVNVRSCPKADIRGYGWNVRFVPKADMDGPHSVTKRCGSTRHKWQTPVLSPLINNRYACVVRNLLGAHAIAAWSTIRTSTPRTPRPSSRWPTAVMALT